MSAAARQAVNRRGFIATMAATSAAAGAFGLFAQSASAAPSSRSPEQEPRTAGSLPSGLGAVGVRQGVRGPGATAFSALKQVDAGLLNVGYAEAGPADGP